MDTEEIFRIKALRKVYRSGTTDLVLFDNLSFRVCEGEMLAIVGQSGAGKSTLLHILGALDSATAGDVFFTGMRLNALSEQDAAEFRNRQIGYVWQFHYLLPEFTALENVAMPLYLRGEDRRKADAVASRWLEEVGLADRGQHRSGELSGGEQQRISLARALITAPRVLLADEPTGDLDNRTAESVFGLISRLHVEHRLTSIIVTHNLSFARRCSRILSLEGGMMREVLPESLLPSQG
ncbi:MAG: ABC transporter ATP-binding protein [Acidobacteria bacterium]|nr:MAG: ABC transporter ATP-binding protein [Acidobacteriota bacterium]